MLRAWLTGVASPPSRCAVCGGWPGEPVCDACVARFRLAQPRCCRCASIVPAGVATCGACLREPPPLDACFAAVPYAYPWSDLVARFKFQGQPGWARALAGWMAEVPGLRAVLDEADLVLPLPLHPARLAERGFNQAMELARRLAPGRADATLLLRIRPTQPQASLARDARAKNVAGAFAVEPLQAARLAGRRVVLVDDVMTSGASLHAAATAVRGAGAVAVGAAVFARTDDLPASRQ